MSDKGLAAPCGGDDNNYYMFYCGYGYENNSYETIAQFAREKFPHLKDLSDQEIKDKHIYWGTESPSFEAMYNGDTFVLFDDADKLPDDKKADAYRCCNLSKSEVVKKHTPVRGSEFDDIFAGDSSKDNKQIDF